MKRPIQIYDQLRSKLTSYIETDFWALDEDFRKARRSLLEDEDLKAISQEPWFELIRKYKSSGKSVSELKKKDLVDQTGNSFLTDDELEFFKKLASAGLVGDFPLYAHQLEMLEQYAKGKNCIITSGTGSGKTESFLLPLFASLSKFYLKKVKVNLGTPDCDKLWYVRDQNKKDKEINVELHRSNDNEHSCVKAAIFYPMNALVSDQISRLRKALSFDGPEKVFQEAGKGRIYFGQYNSRISPIHYNQNGALNAKSKSKIRDEMLAYLDGYKALEEQKEQYADGEFEDLLSTVPHPYRSELLNRYDAQHTPPDILITNPSMLNVIMMRKEEDSIFQKTKEWLESDTENVFHLIVDELHLNRGTAGAEVSWLLQLYLHRIGLHSGHPQLRILASSASLEAADDFVEKFFGFESGAFDNHFKIVKDSFDQPAQNPKEEILTTEKLRELVGFLPAKSREFGNAEEAITRVFGLGLEAFLEQVKSEVVNKLEAPFKVAANRSTISLSKIEECLFEDEPDARALTESLFYVRSLYDGGKHARDLPRLRMHVVFNNLPGLFTQAGSFEKLSNDPYKLIEDGNRMVQLHFCYECGTLLFGGHRHKISPTEFEILPVPAGLDEAPDRRSLSIPDHMEYDDFAIFWPDELNGKELHPEYKQDLRPYEFYGHRNLNKNQFVQSRFGGGLTIGEWKRSYLNPATGRVTINNDANDGIPGYTFILVGNENTNSRALPSKCPCCAQAYWHGHGARRTSPIRHFSTPHNKTAQLLSTHLLKEISDDPDERKLIAFSDSRNDAAKLAAQLEQDNYWDSMRKIVARLAHQHDDYEYLASEIRIHADNGGCWENLEPRLQSVLPRLIPKEHHDGIKFEPHDPEVFKFGLRRLEAPADNSKEPLVISIGDALMPTGVANNVILENLLEKGIPPMGNAFEVKNTIKGNDPVAVRQWKDSARHTKHTWPDAYDGPNDFGTQKSHIAEELRKEFARGLFGRNRFTIEMMAKGYVSFKTEDLNKIYKKLGIDDDLNKAKIREAASTVIRIIGYKFLTISYPEFFRGKTLKEAIGGDPVKKPVVRYLAKVTTDYERTLNAILEILASHNEFVLDPKHFDLVLLREGADIYICQNCQTPHAHRSAGFCAHCMTALDTQHTKKAQDLWSVNYHTQDVEEDIIRLHCEELTGQTEDFETRQRKFKNLFLEHELAKKRYEQIDIISATTTMEVGIDIGSLSATLMGNMAPERYNYQQRVGRAGRGGQAFSLAVTTCRNSSHDSFYYENLDKMLNDAPPTPFYPGNVEEIKRRFFFKELLRLAFGKIENDLPLRDTAKDVHGRMGHVSLWEKEEYRAKISHAIKQALKLDSLEVWRQKTGITISDEEEAINIIEGKLNSPIKSEGIASTLADNGLLPMYGMPTNVRSAILYNFDKVERDAEIGLSEFAPKGELLKDKKYYSMQGITSPRDKKLGSKPVINEDESNVFRYKEGPEGIEILRYEPNQEEGSGYRAAIIPNAYYSGEEYYQTDPNKRRHSIGLPKFNRNNANAVETNTTENAQSQLYTGDLYSINANYDGKGFSFREDNHESRSYRQNCKWWRWKAEDRGDDDQQNRKETFVLANKWYTSVLEIQPNDLNEGLRYGIYREEGDPVKKALNTAIRGAAYSAAFILRSVFTTDLDVDGEELRVLQLRELNDSQKLSILFADKLANGSGFCERLNKDLRKNFDMLFDNRENDFAKILMSDANLHCDSASYSNILNYRNSRFHSILDWRLGLTYLRMIYGINHSEILSADSTLREFQKPDDATWLDGFNADFKVWAENLHMGTHHLHDGLPIALTPDQSTVYIGIHPLWDIENPKGILEKVIKDHEESNRTVKFVDSFNLLRRPGHCKTILMQQNEDDGI